MSQQNLEADRSGHSPAKEESPSIDPRQVFHPELAIDGFTAIDGTVRFYSFVKAIMLRLSARKVLDFGAGRGALALDSRSVWRRHLSDLRAAGAHVTAYDIDPVVRDHTASHEQIVGSSHTPLPFASSHFDIIVSDMTFEHIEHPADTAAELLRVLKPGGYICARTPNKFGYPTIVAAAVPNWLHARLLHSVQPDRMAGDVFLTFYKINSRAAAIKYFAGCKVITIYDMPEPAYYFGSRLAYGGLLALHRILPRVFSTSLFLFIRKREGPLE